MVRFGTLSKPDFNATINAPPSPPQFLYLLEGKPDAAKLPHVALFGDIECGTQAEKTRELLK